jgi:hypothetical protein
MTLRRNAAWDSPLWAGARQRLSVTDAYMTGPWPVMKLAYCCTGWRFVCGTDLAENKVTSANKRLVRFRSFSHRNVYLPADLQVRGAHWCREACLFDPRSLFAHLIFFKRRSF